MAGISSAGRTHARTQGCGKIDGQTDERTCRRTNGRADGRWGRNNRARASIRRCEQKQTPPGRTQADGEDEEEGCVVCAQRSRSVSASASVSGVCVCICNVDFVDYHAAVRQSVSQVRQSVSSPVQPDKSQNRDGLRCGAGWVWDGCGPDFWGCGARRVCGEPIWRVDVLGARAPVDVVVGAVAGAGVATATTATST